MNFKTRLFFTSIGGVALAIGCSTEIITPGAASGAGGGTGVSSTASATAATGNGGAGGEIVFATVATGAGGGLPCAGADLFFDIDGDGATQHFDASCLPEGHFDCGGPGSPPPPPGSPGPPQPPSGFLVLDSCTMKPRLSIVATVSALPGSSINANVNTYYGQSTGDAYHQLSPETAAVTVTSYNDIGGVIEGTYKVIMTKGGGDAGAGEVDLFGQFRVCHTANTCYP